MARATYCPDCGETHKPGACKMAGAPQPGRGRHRGKPKPKQDRNKDHEPGHEQPKICPSTKPRRKSSITGRDVDGHDHFCSFKPGHGGYHLCGNWDCSLRWP
jgi:hypothetical protein